jgi:hypothetical protein
MEKKEEEELPCQYFANVEIHYNGTLKTFDCRSFKIIRYPKDCSVYCLDGGRYVKNLKTIDADSIEIGCLRIPYPIQNDLHWPPPTLSELEKLTTTTPMWLPPPLLQLVFRYAFPQKHQLFVGMCVRTDQRLFMLRHSWSEHEVLEKEQKYSKQYQLVASVLLTIEVPLHETIYNHNEPIEGSLTPPNFHILDLLPIQISSDEIETLWDAVQKLEKQRNKF